MIQIRKTLNILLGKEVVYNKDCTLKGNPCLNITSLPYQIRIVQGKINSIRRARGRGRKARLHIERKGRIIHQTEVFKIDKFTTFKTFLSEKVLSCRTICLVFCFDCNLQFIVKRVGLALCRVEC